jgi:hypothetical protein
MVVHPVILALGRLRQEDCEFKGSRATIAFQAKSGLQNETLSQER